MTPQTLFTDGELREHLARARRQAEQTLLDYDPNRLLLSSEADVSDYLVGLGCVDELVLHRDGAYQLEPREISKQSRDQWDHRIRDVRVTRYTVVVPFSGDPTLLGLRANTFTMNTPSAAVHDQELHIEWDSDYGPGTAELIKSHFNDVIDRIEHTLGFLNRDIAEHNKTITNEMSGRVAARRAKHLADRQMQADLGFPLKTRSDAAAYAIPITRRMLAATRPPTPTGTAFTPEPRLADDDYEAALAVLRSARNALERSPSTASKFNEEELRDNLLVALNSQFKGKAAGEVFNGRGKTDILIREGDSNVFIGECKVWDGPKKFSAAIDQLLTYTTWRDTKAALLIFVKSGNVTDITAKTIDAIKAHPNFKRTGTHASEDRHDFVLHANNDPNREIKLALMLFVVPADNRTT